MTKFRGLPFVLFLSAFVTAPIIASADDRPPTAEEKVQIEKSLRDAGYTTWEEIEFDDGACSFNSAEARDPSPVQEVQSALRILGAPLLRTRP
jgi:hypothetical protein